jgi:hypothetical protein
VQFCRLILHIQTCTLPPTPTTTNPHYQCMVLFAAVMLKRNSCHIFAKQENITALEKIQFLQKYMQKTKGIKNGFEI